MANTKVKRNNLLNNFKKLPNQITLLRILLIPLLYYFAYFNNRAVFTLMLTIAALTDALDGYLARKLKQASKFGLIFDSIADYIVYFSLIPWFYFLDRVFFSGKLMHVGILIALFFLLQIVGILKHRKFISMHTKLGKLSAVLLYLAIILGLLFGFSDALFYLAYIPSLISVFESLILTLNNKDTY